MRTLLAIALSWFGLLAAGAQEPTARDPEALFAEANGAYQVGDFEVARDLYEQLAQREDNWAPGLFHNLGNAYYRLEEFGNAVLAYRRALALDPGHAESRQNLRYLEGTLGFVEFYRSPAVRFLERFHPADIRGAAVLAAWGTAVLLVALLVFRPRAWITAPGILLAALGLAFVVGGMLAFRLVERSRAERLRHHIVVNNDSQIRSAPASTAGAVILLPPGSEVRVLRERGTWSYVEVLKDTRGWVPAEHLVALLPGGRAPSGG